MDEGDEEAAIEEIIVLRLTREEAFALDDLADGWMDRLASDRKLLAAYARTGANLQTTASACDKLRRAVMDEPDSLRWTKLIQHVPDKSRTLLEGHDGLSVEATFEQYTHRPRTVLEAEREWIVKVHEPDITLEKWGSEIEAQVLPDLAQGKK